MEEADTIVVVGTTFKVYPFASLIDYANQKAKIILINQDDVQDSRIEYKYLGNAQDIFELI
jgi:NAD-dependent deacetylase